MKSYNMRMNKPFGWRSLPNSQVHMRERHKEASLYGKTRSGMYSSDLKNLSAKYSPFKYVITYNFHGNKKRTMFTRDMFRRRDDAEKKIGRLTNDEYGKKMFVNPRVKKVLSAKDLQIPRVGERVVSTEMWNLGRKGRRMEGYSDPAKRMSWIKWDDGEVSGAFTKDLVRESDYPKTNLYRLLNEGKSLTAKHPKDMNLFVAKNYLKMAISNRDSEKPIHGYIKFMDSLNKNKRDKILLNPEITKLVDQINRYGLSAKKLSLMSTEDIKRELDRVHDKIVKEYKWLFKNKRFVALQNEFHRRVGG